MEPVTSRNGPVSVTDQWERGDFKISKADGEGIVGSLLGGGRIQVAVTGEAATSEAR